MGVSKGDGDGGGVDGDGSGGTFPSRQGARTETLSPELVFDGGGARSRISRNPFGCRVFSAGAIYGPKGGVGGCTRRPDNPRARPRVFFGCADLSGPQRLHPDSVLNK